MTDIRASKDQSTKTTDRQRTVIDADVRDYVSYAMAVAGTPVGGAVVLAASVPTFETIITFFGGGTHLKFAMLLHCLGMLGLVFFVTFISARLLVEHLLRSHDK
jgi:hypothetical protein